VPPVRQLAVRACRTLSPSKKAVASHAQRSIEPGAPSRAGVMVLVSTWTPDASAAAWVSEKFRCTPHQTPWVSLGGARQGSARARPRDCPARGTATLRRRPPPPPRAALCCLLRREGNAEGSKPEWRPAGADALPETVGGSRRSLHASDRAPVAPPARRCKHWAARRWAEAWTSCRCRTKSSSRRAIASLNARSSSALRRDASSCCLLQHPALCEPAPTGPAPRYVKVRESLSFARDQQCSVKFSLQGLDGRGAQARREAVFFLLGCTQSLTKPAHPQHRVTSGGSAPSRILHRTK